jgi:long-chain acyl-CoA synthetase
MSARLGSEAVPDGWTFADLIARLREDGGDALTVVRDGQLTTTSRSETAGLATRFAAGLLRDGLTLGEPIVMYAPNGPEWAVARLGIGLAGGVAVPIDDLAGAEEAAIVVRDVGSRRIVTTGEHACALAGMRLSAQCIVLEQPGGEGVRPWEELLAHPSATGLPQVAASAPATIVYTSGTTGTPKSFALTYRNIAANLRGLLEAVDVGPGDRALLPLPLHHVYPTVVGLLTPLIAGASVVFPQSVTAQHLQQALHAARVTVMVGVPRLYAALLDGIDSRVRQRGALARLMFRSLERLSREIYRRSGRHIGKTVLAQLHRSLAPDLRLMVSGGARLDAELIWRLDALGWEVLSGYGLAETASVFTANRLGAKRTGSEGKPLAGEVRIADSNAAGEGEIQLRGANVFAGYRNNEEANRAAFTADGWFRTGDLGRVDDEGYVYVTGRAKEMLVLGGGKNVYPDELEPIYGASPLITEIAVLERDGALVALVQPDLAEIQARNAGHPEDAVRIALAETSRQLPPYQRLAGFALVRDSLPRTRLGKFRRFLLPALYEQAKRGAARAATPLSTEDEAALRVGPAAELWKILRQRYADKPLSLEASPQLDLGIDSLEAMSLSLEIQARLGVLVSEQQIAEAATVRDLIGLVHAAAASAAPARITPEHLAWLAPPSRPAEATGTVLHSLNRAAMRLAFRLRVRGLEHLPAQPPFVIVANHASDLDPLAMAAALPARLRPRLRWGADVNRLFGTRAARLFSRSLHIFPVDDRAPTVSLALAAEVLKRGDVLVWFPEEWRSPSGEVQRFRAGIGFILQQAPVPVVPAFLAGTFAALPRTRRWPRLSRIGIVFGPARSRYEFAHQPPAEVAATLERAVIGLAAD